MKKKKVVFVYIISIIALAFGITAMTMYLPRSINNIVSEETDGIIKIVKLTQFESSVPSDLKGTEPVLHSDYYGEFVELAREIKYVKFYNLRRLKCAPRFSTNYVIYYENGNYIELNTALHHVSGAQIVRYSYLTKDPFPQIEELFAKHTIA